MKNSKHQTALFFTLALLVAQGLFAVQKSSASSSLVKIESGATSKEKLDFWTGFSLFRSPWVAAPSSTTGRDGLGPLFNARACSACHKSGGHGKLPNKGPGLVARLGIYDADKKEITPLQNYGSQLQTLSIKTMVSQSTLPAEATLKLGWQQTTITHGNKSIKLKKPIPLIESPTYGALPSSTHISLRLAPPLFGLGLLEKIPEHILRKQSDEHDKNKDGISGKAAKVWSQEHNQWAIGRFGYKAEQPSLVQQTAAAFHNDIGISSWLYPMQNCAKKQTKCQQAATGNSKEEGVEISRQKLQFTTLFTQKLKQPAQPTWNKNQKGQAKKGQQRFNDIGCADCHIESYTLTNKQGSTTISPYTDLLLHDMGEGLSDNKSINNANGNEWRTTPLWGIKQKLSRKNISLLHDGRANSIEEAIGWHNGEAEKSATQYFSLNKQDRQNLNLFISHL